MKSGRQIWLIGLIIVLGGCASTYVPMNPDATQLDFNQAKYTCMQQSQPSGSFSAQGSQRFVATATGVAVFATIAAQQANFRACMGANGWMLGQANQQQIQAPQQVNNAGAVVVTPPPPLSAQTTPPPPAAPVVPVHEKLEATTVCDQARDHTNVYRRLGCDLRDKEQEDQVRQDINREEAYNDTHGPSAN